MGWERSQETPETGDWRTEPATNGSQDGGRPGGRESARERFQPVLTIEHIATLAEVSRSTVSRVLNNHPSVRPTVRERVLQVIREQNYAPQAAARSLANSRTDTIGLLVTRSAAFGLADPFIASTIQSLFEASAQQGYFVMLAMLT